MKRLLKNLSIKSKIALIILLPMCGYLVTSGLNILSTYDRLSSARETITMVEFSGRISMLVHELQKERGASSGFLGSKGQKFGDILRQQHTDTDGKVSDYEKAGAGLRNQPAGATLTDQTRRVETALRDLATTRNKVSSQQIEAREAISYYTTLIKTLIDTISATSHLSDNPDITGQLFAYVNFLQCKERAGIERATMSAVFSKGAFTAETYSRFLQLLAAQENYLAAFLSEAVADTRKIYETTVQGAAVDEVQRMRQTACLVHNLGRDREAAWSADQRGGVPTHRMRKTRLRAGGLRVGIPAGRLDPSAAPLEGLTGDARAGRRSSSGAAPSGRGGPRPASARPRRRATWCCSR